MTFWQALRKNLTDPDFTLNITMFIWVVDVAWFLTVFIEGWWDWAWALVIGSTLTLLMFASAYPTVKQIFHQLRNWMIDRAINGPAHLREAALTPIVQPQPEPEIPSRPSYRYLVEEFDELLAADLMKLDQTLDPGPKIALIRAFYDDALRQCNELLEPAYPTDNSAGCFAVSIDRVIPDFGLLILKLLMIFDDKAATEAGAGGAVREAFQRNVDAVSRESLSQKEMDAGKRIYPTRYTGDNIIRAYLTGTPFFKLFWREAPLPIPDVARFRHQWVIAPPGAGKTTLLGTQIEYDLFRVQNEECSIIVIDSQGMEKGNLIGRLARFKEFAPGGLLEGRLVLLEPRVEAPLALNFFDMDLDRTENMSPRDRHMLQASAQELITFSLSAMTDKQADLFAFVVRLVMRKPNASLVDMVQVLEQRTLGEYAQYVDQSDPFMVKFFGAPFEGATYKETKQEVYRRLFRLVSNPVFANMFGAARNRFRMLDEISPGKVICIHTDRALLGEEACGAFGRFFIAQLIQASERRSVKAAPLFCYIDECQDYIAEFEGLAGMLDKARKRNVGMVLAHQRLSQIKNTNVRDALSNSAIKMAGQNRDDPATVAKLLHTTPEFIEGQRTGNMACFFAGMATDAFQIRIPEVMANMEMMTDEEFEAIRADMFQRYGAEPSTAAPPKSKAPPPPDNIDEVEI